MRLYSLFVTSERSQTACRTALELVTSSKLSVRQEQFKTCAVGVAQEYHF